MTKVNIYPTEKTNEYAGGGIGGHGDMYHLGADATGREYRQTPDTQTVWFVDTSGEYPVYHTLSKQDYRLWDLELMETLI